MKKIYWILIGILALILIGLEIYYYSEDEGIAGHEPSPTTSSILSPSSIATPVSTPTMTEIKIFMIAIDDNGKSGKLIGCGDSAVAVIREIPYTQAVLKAAMTELVSIKNKNYGESGLYNPLYQSNLDLISASIDDNGKAIVKFSGNLQLVGTCEDPRIQAQLEETALQFSSVKSVEIWINDRTLKEIMSLE